MAASRIVLHGVTTIAVLAGALVAGLAAGKSRLSKLSVQTPPVAAAEMDCTAPHNRAQLGQESEKVKRENGHTLLWAGGAASGKSGAQWYDFTGSPIPPDMLQFGIGKDTIRAIDDPLFVEPDDPRLLQLRPSPYRRSERPTVHSEIPVIGYARAGDVRAYPLALLDRHELVNDWVGGKPVTVGW